MTLEQSLSGILVERHPREAAKILEQLPADQCRSVLRSLSPQTVSRALSHMEPSLGGACLAEWPEGEVDNLFTALAPEVAARLLERIGPESRRSLLDRVPPTASAQVKRLLRYAEGTAGALMDPRIVQLPMDLSVGEARQRVTKQHANGLFYIYVMDRAHRLVGVLTWHELSHAAPEAPIASLMNTNVVSLSVRAGSDAILAHPGWADHHALPVVDLGGELVGVVRYGTLRRLEREATGESTDSLTFGFGIADLYLFAASAVVDGVMNVIESGARTGGWRE